jgi:hypothetical protein
MEMIMENFSVYFELALILAVIIWLLLIAEQQPKSIGVLLLRSRYKRKG